MMPPTKILLAPPPSADALEHRARIKDWVRTAGGWSAEAFVVISELENTASGHAETETLIAVFPSGHRAKRFVLPLPAQQVTQHDVQRAIGFRFIHPASP